MQPKTQFYFREHNAEIDPVLVLLYLPSPFESFELDSQISRSLSWFHSAIGFTLENRLFFRISNFTEPFGSKILSWELAIMRPLWLWFWRICASLGLYLCPWFCIRIQEFVRQDQLSTGYLWGVWQFFPTLKVFPVASGSPGHYIYIYIFYLYRHIILCIHIYILYLSI